MSAFVALIDRRGRPVDPALLALLTAPFGVYAPHGRGAHVDGPVALAHGLLAARENATIGPHAGARGLWLAGDVRLDAQAELRSALRSAEAPVTADCPDEELLLAAWARWGEDSLTRLRGDFSFALWDAGNRTLWCARDPFGVRALFYADLGEAFVCSNVLEAVRAHPDVSDRLDERAVVSFLDRGFNADLSTTTFADVRRVPPAHCMLVPTRATHAGPPRRYWSFPSPPPLVYAHDEEYVEQYRSLLGESVRDRLRVPRATILMSGGIDSPSLAATVRRVSPATALVAYTVVLDGLIPDDERRFAGLVAARLGIRHEIANGVRPSLEHLADPEFRSPEPLHAPDHAEWRLLASRIGAESPVLFYGEDADAIFEPPGMRTMLRTWPVWDVVSRAVRYTVTHRRHPHLGLWLRNRLAWPRTATALGPPPWIRPSVLGRTGKPSEPIHPAHPTRPRAQRFLLGTVWQSIFEEMSPAYTGVPLEARLPFLDTRLLEFAFAIPPIPWCQRKELMRVALDGELPDEVLRRPKSPLKGVVEARVAHWRATPSAIPSHWEAATREFVDVDQALSIMRSGTAEEAYAAWRVLELDHWLRSL